MRLRNRNYLFAAVAATALSVALAGCSGASNSTSSSSGSSSSSSSGSSSGSAAADGDSLSTTSTSVGDIIVDANGMTVYYFANDTKGESASTCTGACLKAWPPVLTSGTPMLSGVTGTVGTIAAANGKKQVTIDGLPIYTFAGDKKKGDITGQDINQSGGLWWVVAPDGTKITTKP